MSCADTRNGNGMNPAPAGFTVPANKVYCLVDSDNFYASCEKLFRPDLKNVPVVVLSSNDGCIVARSAEAKALGIKMGTPYFQIKHELARNNVEVFSSNFALYGDISSRILSVLEEMSPECTPYSIDESFLTFSGMTALGSLEQYARQIRQRVRQCTGISTSLGIAPTKTLAKLATAGAKRYPATGGVVDLCDPARQRRLMAITEVGDVWGVGQRYEEQLRALGIETALQLAQANPKDIRNRFSVVLERTVLELNGESCVSLDDAAVPRQQIICSRSFAQGITGIESMRQAVAGFVCQGAERLRRENQKTKQLTVFIRACPHRDGPGFYSRQACVDLIEPTSDSRRLAGAAHSTLQAIWLDGHHYKKAGIILSDMHASGTWQPDLLHEPMERPGADALMSTIDAIRQKGLGRVFLASQGVQPERLVRQERLSPAYTTRWECLPVVR